MQTRKHHNQASAACKEGTHSPFDSQPGEAGPLTRNGGTVWHGLGLLHFGHGQGGSGFGPPGKGKPRGGLKGGVPLLCGNATPVQHACGVREFERRDPPGDVLVLQGTPMGLGDSGFAPRQNLCLAVPSGLMWWGRKATTSP